MWLALIGAASADPLVEGSDDDGSDDEGLGDIHLVDDPTDEGGIVNGEIERGYRSAVGLGIQGFPFTLCTGSLITPRMVLTAAHCSAGYPIELIVELGVAFVGSDAADPRDELLFAGGATHPDYQELAGTFLGENDVAVLILEQDATQPPVWFRTEPLRAREAEGAEVISVGWGLDENNQANVKRSAPLVVAELDDMFLVSLSSQNENQANICSGDSGGPQYHVEDDGTLVQWAVHSWGDIECRFESGSTRTDQVGDWILDQVEAEHGSRDQCSVFGYYGDGICQTWCDNLDPDCVEDLSAAELAAEQGRSCGCASGSLAPAWLPLTLAALILVRPPPVLRLRTRSGARTRPRTAGSRPRSPGTTST